MHPNKLIEHWGTVKAAAKAIGVTPGAIYQWIDAGRVPKLRAFQIQVLMSATKGSKQ